MGNTGVEKRKKKKKGRPSLLDLQKRSLKQQQEQQPPPHHNHNNHKRNPNPNSKEKSNNGNGNPYLRFPNSTSRATRRNPNPKEEEEEEEEEEDEGGKRREKKLKLVLKLPANGRPAVAAAELDSSGSEEDGGGMRTRFKKRKIDAVDAAGSASAREKTERHNSLPKAATEGELLDSEPSTPLPDKKLLVFILDRLQKKDTYGVFSEPVDPSDLPDYHDIIKHPMDFSTIRKKLANEAYASLEQFEEDVFLISSNAMRYNSRDTIYFRQARSIQELAKKDFDNLRQESDDNEPEPKIVRRGRPPSKNTTKKPVGRPPAEHASFNVSSNTTVANASVKAFMSTSSNDMLRKGSTSDRPGIIDSSTRIPYVPRNSENYSWVGEKKSERNEEHSGSTLKGLSTRYGKKVIVSEENRRNTYKQPPSTSVGHEPSILTTFDGESRELLPVGLHMEHSYARSLARFAANLGPVGWEIAARQIERVLPPGTKFGRGWVGEKDVPQPPLLSTSSSVSSQPVTVQSPSTSKADCVPERLESFSSNMLAPGGNQPSRSLPTCSSAAAISNRMLDNAEIAESSKSPNYHHNFNPPTSAGIRPKAPFQLHQTSAVHPTVNGFNTRFGYKLPQLGQMARPTRPTGSLSSDVPMTHAQALDMVSRSNSSFVHPASIDHFDVERTKTGNPSMVNPKNTFFHQTASCQVDAEQLKSGSSNAANFTNKFVHTTAMSPLEAERTKLNNPNTLNTSSNRFIHPAAGQPEAERARLSNPNTVDSGNRIINNAEATRQTQSQRAALGNSSTINSGTSFTHPAGAATGHSEPETTKLGNPSTITSGFPMPEPAQESQGFWRNLSLNPRPDSAPPDLNVRFQSPGSPASSVVVDSQQPDLALQL